MAAGSEGLGMYVCGGEILGWSGGIKWALESGGRCVEKVRR